jgi:hypothetical protein
MLPSRLRPERLPPEGLATFLVRLAAFHPAAADPELLELEHPAASARLVADLERPAVALALDSSARPRLAAHLPAEAAVVDLAAAVVEQRHSTR